MDSQRFDAPGDPLLGFASEIPNASVPEQEPAFLRTPTLGDAPLSITSLRDERPPQKGRVGFVATVSVTVGVLSGFAAGYALAHRAVVPAPPSTPVGAPSGNSETPRAEPPTESARASSAVAPAVPTHTNVTSVPSTPASTTRRSTIAPPAAAIVPTTSGHAGAIEVMSHPRGAQVLLDGNVVGLAPLSIADIGEGMHELRVELAGFNPWVAAVRVKDGSRARVRASLDR
jgi:PEGA domain